MILPDELRHVREGARPDETPGGAGLIEVIADADSAVLVLSRAREVLEVVLAGAAAAWLPVEEWRERLPAWFVAACAPELSAQDAENWLLRWRQLSPEQRAAEERDQPWSLVDWLHWLEPDNRTWFWWDAAATDDALHVVVEVPGAPAPLGALEWLLRASGAGEVRQDAMSC
jgi:hypothetical protein